MYKVKIGIKQAIFGLLVGVGCLFSSGCVRLGPEPSVHPHLEVTAPILLGTTQNGRRGLCCLSSVRLTPVAL